MTQGLGCTLSFLLMAVLSSTSSAQNCTICGTAGNNFTNPTAKYNGRTCGQLQADLDALGNAEACDSLFLSPTYTWFQQESFCGCEGSTAPDSCNICGDGEILAFPNSYVPWEQQEERYTCAEMAELARHVSDSTVCSNVVATPAVKETCCRKMGEVCPVCQLAGTNFNRELRYDNITCEMLESATKGMNNNQCKAYYGQDTHYWMNWESFCGCEGAQEPKGCPLCGTDMEVVNPDAIAPWENETDVYTCAQAHDLASHITDEIVCTDEVQTQKVKEACCGPIAGGGGDSAAFAPAAILSAATAWMVTVSMMMTV